MADPDLSATLRVAMAKKKASFLKTLHLRGAEQPPMAGSDILEEVEELPQWDYQLPPPPPGGSKNPGGPKLGSGARAKTLLGASPEEVDAEQLEYMMRLAYQFRPTPPAEEPGKSDTASGGVPDKEKVAEEKGVEKSVSSDTTETPDYSSRVVYISTTEEVMAQRYNPREEGDLYPGRVPLESVVLHAADWGIVDFAKLQQVAKRDYVVVTKAFIQWAAYREWFGENIGENTFEPGIISLDNILRTWDVTYRSLVDKEAEALEVQTKLAAIIIEKDGLLKKCMAAEQRTATLQAQYDALQAGRVCA